MNQREGSFPLFWLNWEAVCGNMSAPRARMRSEREAKISDVNKPVIGLRPLKERNKRSEAMIEEQVDTF